MAGCCRTLKQEGRNRFCDLQRLRDEWEKGWGGHLLRLTGVIIKGSEFLPSSLQDGLKNG